MECSSSSGVFRVDKTHFSSTGLHFDDCDHVSTVYVFSKDLFAVCDLTPDEEHVTIDIWNRLIVLTWVLQTTKNFYAKLDKLEVGERCVVASNRFCLWINCDAVQRED